MKANLIGAAALVITGGYIFFDFTNKDVQLPCMASYPPAVSLNLEKGNGELLSAVALQGRSQSQDWGLLDTLSVERVAGAPVSNAFRIALKKDDVASSGSPTAGAGFPWQPSRLNGTASVCFSYNVWLPKDFSFKAGGTLPGVASGQRLSFDESIDDDEGRLVRTLRAHMAWSDEGMLQVVMFDPSIKYSSRQTVLSSNTRLTPGRWHRLEQEIVLNDDGQSNGNVRVWLDGKIALDAQNLSIRKSPDSKIETAFYHVARGTPRGSSNAKAETDSYIKVSPMELSWR